MAITLVVSRSTPATLVRALSEFEQNLLNKGFNRDSQPFIKQQQLLKELRESGQWLGCDCKERGEPPSLHIKRSNTGLYFLTNNNRDNRPAHHPDCPLFHAKKVKSLYETPTDVTREKTKTSYSLHRRIKEEWEVSEPSNSLPSVSSGKSENTLWRLIKNVFESARINQVIGGFKPSYRTTVDMISSAAKHFTIGGYEGEPLNKHLYFSVADLPKAREQINQQTWNAKGRAHAIFLLLADELEKTEAGYQLIRMINGERKTFLLKKESKEDGCRTELQSDTMLSMKGPFCAIVSIANINAPSKRPYIVPVKAFVFPIETKSTFVPVKNDYERGLLKHARTLLSEQHAHKQVKLLKPLKAMVTIDNDEVTPDFYIESKRNSAIIDVFASLEKDYFKDKKAQQATMGKLAKVFEFDAITADFDMQFDELSIYSINRAVTYVIAE